MSPGALPQANLKAAPLALYRHARPGAHWDGSIIFDCRFAIEEERFAQRSGYREAIAKIARRSRFGAAGKHLLKPGPKAPGPGLARFPRSRYQYRHVRAVNDASGHVPHDVMAEGAARQRSAADD